MVEVLRPVVHGRPKPKVVTPKRQHYRKKVHPYDPTRPLPVHPVKLRKNGKSARS